MSLLGAHEVSINGTAYRVVQELYVRRFLDVVRQQGASQDEPSEFSLNPNDLWRRSQVNFTHGAGQLVYDDGDDDRKRFWTSDGVDSTAADGVVLSPAVNRVDSNGSGVEYSKAVPTQDGVYIVVPSSTTMQYVSSGTATTDAAAHNIVDATSDGSTLYAAVNNGAGAGGVYPYTGTTLGTIVNNLVPDKIAFVRGRLICAVGSELHNITDLSSATAPAAFTNNTYTGLEWVAFGETQSMILAASKTGDQSFIHRITLREDGTGLTAPLILTQLPDGEFVRAMRTYLGVLVIVTSKGIRIGQVTDSSLVYGRLVHEATDIYDAEARGNFVHYGSDGDLWVLDLGRFVTNRDVDLVPSHSRYAVTGQSGNVLSVFAVPSNASAFSADDYDVAFLQATGATTTNGGLWELDRSNHATSGTLTTSRITYGMFDTKQFLYLDVVAEHEGSGDIIYVQVELDDGTVTSTGSLPNGTGSKTFYVNRSGEHVRFRFQLDSGDQVNGSTTPKLVRFTLRALPVPSRTEQIVVPVDLRSHVTGLGGGEEIRDLWLEYNALRALVLSGEPIEYIEFDQTYTASVENVQWGPELEVERGNHAWEGTALVTLRIYDVNTDTLEEITPDTSTSMFGKGTFGSDGFGERGDLS